jgi:hypothetical protein
MAPQVAAYLMGEGATRRDVQCPRRLHAAQCIEDGKFRDERFATSRR